MRLALCLVLVLSVLALQADAGRSRVDVLIQKLLRTHHEAPASSQSGGSIQSTQSGSPAGGASVNSAGSVSNTISAVSPNNFPSASSASSSGALQPGSVVGSASVSTQAPASVSTVSSGSSAAPAKPKSKKGKGRLTVVSNINVMNSKAQGVNKASADLAFITEQHVKNSQEGRQKNAENNRAQIEAEDVRKKDKEVAIAQDKVNEFNKKQTIIEESRKAEVAAANKAAEEELKEKNIEKEESTKAKEKADEATAKAAAAAAAKQAAEEQKQKADAAEASKKEEAKKAAAKAKEEADKAAQVAKESRQKKKAEEKAKAAALEKKTKAEAKTKAEETAKAKYILKPSPFAVTKGNKIGDATGSAAYTVLFWYKPEGKGSDFTNIIHHGEDDFSRGPAIYMFPDSSQLHICSAGKADKDWNQCVDPEPLPAVQTWTHVAIIHKLDGIYVLYNGEQVARLADSGPKGIAGPIYAGSPFADPAPAQLSDVRWVSDALTVDDIKAIYKQAKNTPKPAF